VKGIVIQSLAPFMQRILILVLTVNEEFCGGYVKYQRRLEQIKIQTEGTVTVLLSTWKI